MILQQFTDCAGKIRITWQCESGNAYMFKFSEMPSEEKLIELGEERDKETFLSEIEPLNLGVEDSFNVVPDAILAIKANLEVNFEDYLTYMSELNWQYQVTLKMFMFKLVNRLYGDSTEEEGFIIAKDFIHSKSLGELERLFEIKLG